jgi:death on curing protein
VTTPSLGRPRFLSPTEVLEFHAMSIQHFGGSAGLRDPGALDSAIAMPKQGFGGEYAHAFPFGMASAYAFHIAKNHPFVDGNKRTALMTAGAFLRMNGWDLVSEGVAAADAVIALVTDQMTKADFAAWLEANCHARTSFELRDFFAEVTLPALLETASKFQTDAGATVPELRATIDEASRHLPLVADLFDLVEPVAGSASASTAPLVRDLKTFLALYRIAEDMGYEW